MIACTIYGLTPELKKVLLAVLSNKPGSIDRRFQIGAIKAIGFCNLPDKKLLESLMGMIYPRTSKILDIEISKEAVKAIYKIWSKDTVPEKDFLLYYLAAKSRIYIWYKNFKKNPRGALTFPGIKYY